MKKLSFEKFEIAKIKTNHLNQILGGSATAGGTWSHSDPNAACGTCMSFNYASDTADGGTTTYHNSSGHTYQCNIQ